MSGHMLMGHQDARLETMVLVIRSYVLVYIVGKMRWISPYERNLLMYVIRRPCSLGKLLTRNRTLFNVSFHVRTLIIVGILPKYLISYHKYHSTYGYDIRPTDTIVPVGYFHIHCFNPINLYLSMRYIYIYIYIFFYFLLLSLYLN